MITLALFRQMCEDEMANLTKNVDFFWEELPLQSGGKPAQGVWLVTRSGDASRSPTGHNLKSTVDFYVAMPDKSMTEAVHSQILDYILAHPCFCKLEGRVGATSYGYKNVRLRPTATPQNDGITENGLIVKMASAQVIYDKSTSTT